MNENSNEQLGYVSSAPLLVRADDPTPQDVEDMPTLVEIFYLLEDRKRYYQSIESLALENETFTIEQQLAVNKKALFHVQELQIKISSAIAKVRKFENGRQ